MREEMAEYQTWEPFAVLLALAIAFRRSVHMEGCSMLDPVRHPRRFSANRR